MQAEIDKVTEGAVIFVTAGEYDVTHDDAENVAYDHNLVISKDNITLVGEKGTVISSAYTSGMGDAQQTIMIKSDNVALKNLKVNPVKDYNNKTVEIMGAKNTVIKNCEIVGNLYIGGAETGVYTVAGNTFSDDEVSIVVSNGAGNAMKAGEKAVIKDNVCEGALYLTGTRNTGWDLNELTNIPEITGNTFGACKQEVNGKEYSMYIRVASTVKANLDKVDVEDIKTNNSFDGKSGDEWSKTDVEDTTQYAGTFYRFYY